MVGQAEIFDYLRGLADKYDLRRNIHFGRTMTGGYWDAERQRWHVHTESGDEYVAQFVVSGIGALHIPNVPDLPGADTSRARRSTRRSGTTTTTCGARRSR